MDPIQHSIELFQNYSHEIRGFTALCVNELKSFLPEHRENVNSAVTNILAGAEKELGATCARNLSSMLGKARKMHHDRTGRDLSPEELNKVPIDVGAELIRVAKYVSDEELISQYAALLQSFIEDGGHASRVAFVNLLNNMSGLDALVFRRLYSVELKAHRPQVDDNDYQNSSISKGTDLLFESQNLAVCGILTIELPVKASQYTASASSDACSKQLATDILISLGNLARLNLIEPDRIVDGGMNYKVVYQTPLGSAFAGSLRIVSQS
jgi:hypothetical protein